MDPIIEPNKKRVDSNLKHLSIITFLTFVVGFVLVWMLASALWGVLSKPEREVSVVTSAIDKQLDEMDEEFASQQSLLDDLDVPESSEVKGASTGDPELDSDIRALDEIDIYSIDKDYR